MHPSNTTPVNTTKTTSPQHWHKPTLRGSRIASTLMTALLLTLALLPSTAAAEMESALLNHIANADIRGTKVSVCVMDVGQRLLLAEIHDDREMIPASNMKLITTAAALHTLGKDFTFTTKLKMLSNKDAPAGDGLPALVVQGDGDPAFGSPNVLEDAGYSVDQMLGWWIDAVEKTGLDQFNQIIVDDRIFDRGPDQRVHPSWPKNQLHKWYCAQVMGINFFDNCFLISANPTRTGQDARVTVYPYGPFVQTEMRLKTGRSDQWDIITRPDSNRLAFRGSIRNRQQQYVAMHDPALVFGEVLKHELSKRNITVGEVVRPADDQRLPEGKVLHKLNTTLQAVLNRVNQDSQNLYAEAILKRSGHAITGAPGTFENGAAAVREYLAKTIKDPTMAASIKLADGSGLSRENRVSARAMVEVLRVQATSKDFRPFLASMAKPGEEGSLRKRFVDEDDKLIADLYAKTGTINHVSALSGYLVYPDAGPNNTARVLAFSILANGHGLGQARNISAVTIRKLQNELIQIMDEETVGQLVP
ncbi:MAG: D-alanyl-D-alanine carboxypeptidase/D-alanyl-D-alanine-endopeptidase [Phycisphaeraceae bacterium]